MKIGSTPGAWLSLTDDSSYEPTSPEADTRKADLEKLLANEDFKNRLKSLIQNIDKEKPPTRTKQIQKCGEGE